MPALQINPADLVVRPASDDQLAAVLHSIYHNEKIWTGIGISYEQYVARERARKVLCDSWIVYVLVPAADEETTDFLASAQTYAMAASWAPPGVTTVEGLLNRPAVFTTCMYVPPDKRGASLSLLLLAKLQDKFRPAPGGGSEMPELEPYLFFGFNDVFPGYYKQFSKALPSFHTIWPTEGPLGDADDTRPIGPDDLGRVAARDVELLRREVLTCGPSKDHRWVVLPTARVHRLRVGIAELNTGKRPDCVGAELPGEDAFMLWSRNPMINTLRIHRLRASTRDQFERLLAAARRFAKLHGLDTVRAWSVPDHLHDPAGPQPEPRPVWIAEVKLLSDEAMPAERLHHLASESYLSLSSGQTWT